MTRLAGMAEVCRHMVRICGALVIRLMTGVTIGVRDLVIAVRVAGKTWNRHVTAGQWEYRYGMVERRGTPRCCGMTGNAIMTEIPPNMIWINGLLEIVPVTLIATGVDKLVIAVPMALLAGEACVGTREGKASRIVIKCRWLPGICRVTCLAIVTEVSCQMIRRLRRCIIFLVATVAIGRKSGEPIARVALRADNGSVSACKGKSGEAVIETG